MNNDVLKLLAPQGFDTDALRAVYERERDRRVRPGGAGHRRITAGWEAFEKDPAAGDPVAREPRHDVVDVAVIGAGHGGLLAGAKLRDAGVERIRMIDTAADVGGTWYWNRYPGVQCDVESYIYMPLLDELGYVPTEKYAYGPELFAHTRRIAEHYDLYRDALLQTKLTELTWQEEQAGWEIATDRGDRFHARFVVIANGNLSRPQLPGIEGLADFRGRVFHTSRWDYDYTGGSTAGDLDGLRDKTVGIIGTGATAVQVVPHLAEAAEKLIVFQRTPSVVVPRNNRPTDPEWAASLKPGWQRKRMENFTRILSGELDDVDRVHDSWTELYRAVTEEELAKIGQELGRELDPAEKRDVVELIDMLKGERFRDRIRSTVSDPETAAALLPWYQTHCKRPCFHDEYLPAFNRPNVEVVDTATHPVRRFTETGVEVDGKVVELDCMVLATGFEVATSYRSQTGFDPVGRDGVHLSERWQEGPRTLHGLQSRSFPNLFTMGIIQNASSINFTEMLTHQAVHLAHVVSQVRDRGYEIVEVTPDGEARWRSEMVEHATEAELKRWQECTPSYINGEGNVAAPFSFFTRKFGGGTLKFVQILEDWRAAGSMDGLELRHPARGDLR
ncbi:NAD(P)/FAD-dependent oxidoreductase [Pseudonocardia ailaonensis]|uniref:NAD(P)/FAD-dependent oxidoreductase n=1 Tax=Pseudonocardia ailaonensis TaxID=367279 RepID=A0ABN2N0B7_9PSEU